MSTSTRTNRLMPSDTGTSPSRAGKQIKCSAATLKAALELQATLKADILRGEHRQGHTVTFAEYAREWVESYQGRTTRGFREATRSEYRRSVEKAIPWFAGHCPKLSDAEPRDMRLYVAWLQKDGRALSTVRNHFNVIRAMFATAVEDGLLRHNPCASVRASRVSTGQTVSPEVQRRALGEADIAALLGAAGEWRLFFQFMIHTGLIGEALELQWADIEFGERPRVKVRRQTRRGITNAPKTAAGRREVPLSRSVAQRLWTLHRGHGGEDPVFAHPATGERMEYHWAEHKVLRPAREAAGLDWLTFHGLRHTCASLLFANGKNLKQVQHWLGHSSPQLTQNTYLHLMDDGLGGADFLDKVTAGVDRRLRDRATGTLPSGRTGDHR